MAEETQHKVEFGDEIVRRVTVLTLVVPSECDKGIFRVRPSTTSLNLTQPAQRRGAHPKSLIWSWRSGWRTPLRRGTVSMNNWKPRRRPWSDRPAARPQPAAGGVAEITGILAPPRRTH
jgi:hypothetical protein